MAKLRASLLLALLSAGIAVAQSQSAGSGADTPIQWETDSFSLDRKANVTTFDGFRIDAGNWSLVADSARAHSDSLDFRSGEWRFEGNVRVAIETASVAAEGAVFRFRNQELVSGEFWGTPVVFEDTAAEQDNPIVGRAEQLRYDRSTDSVELLGTVALTVGPYETTGCDLVYFLGTERFTTGSADCAEPFRTVIPREREQGGDDDAASDP